MKYSKQDLYDRLAQAVNSLGDDIEYAIGGAEAMAAHGYIRTTNDIDVYVLEKDLNRFSRALRKAGMDIYTVHEPDHFVAELPGNTNRDQHIDILVAAHSEPELSGVEFPAKAELGGYTWRIFDANLLAMAKFVAADYSGDPKHVNDLLAMYRRGIFDPASVRYGLAYVDGVDVKDFDALIESFKTKKGKKRPPGDGKRLPRK